jgi:hypothetical protein
MRGTPALRPPVDRGLAGGLRAWLEDGILSSGVARSKDVVRLTTSSVGGAPTFAPPAGVLRGALVAQLVRLRVAGGVVEDPFDDATCAMAASGRNDDLLGILADLDPDEHARLAAEVAAHDAVLADRLGAIPSWWSPRCGVRQSVPVAGGSVVLRGLVDVALGEVGSPRASVCLLEVTTSRLAERHDTVLSYLALLETLRTGEQPLRVAALSSADGSFVVRDVTPELLGSAVEHVLLALQVECAA